MNLSELEALAKAATPGPWETNKEDIISNVMEVIANNGYVSVCDADPYDALFIAHANPQTILQMIALIRQIGDALEVASDLTMPYDDCECSVCKAVDAWKEFKRGH